MKPGKTGLQRVIDAAGYSIKGIKFVWANEAAFRQECILALIMIPLAFVIAESVSQIILLVVPIVLVLIIELINSAIEAIVDRIGDEIHELSGAAKDIGSAAVLLALLLTAFIWIIIILHNFFALFS